MMPMAAYEGRGEARPPWTRALVTGGAGFLGPHVCARLLDEGVAVDCLDDLSTGRAGSVAPLAGRRGFRFLELDIADPASTAALTGPYDLVLHLAGPADPRDAGGPGTRTALAVAGRDTARFLLASSPPRLPGGAVTGGAGPAPRAGDPLDARGGPVRFSEALVVAHAGTHGLDAGIVRLFTGYGPGMRTDTGGDLAALVGQALAGQPVTVAGDGDRTHPLCYVDDMVDGVLRVAAGRSVRPVDIGGDEHPTTLEIARRLADLVGHGAPPVFGGRAADGPAEPAPVTGFAREIFGWRPRVPWPEGLARTVAAARAGSPYLSAPGHLGA
ncbi:NAD-dependent epimerase/dehydratase family protein [Streptomyces sp. NRRL F-5065]|uniref:NAD-dependent epimerase/dehydratase family protein n=1 Tax=Streptomyces sp. NRRL F-5065 TaxID=1463855 RepID=UPI00068C1001|nr:NAD-dependent epimerase/dehydratase family protein [Streptomyces sp. NRRL F-5065]